MESDTTSIGILPIEGASSVEVTPSTITVTKPIGTLFVIVIADILALTLALSVSVFLRNLVLGEHSTSVFKIALPVGIFTICCFTLGKLYPGICENPIEELRRCSLATTLAFLALGASTSLSRDMSQSRLTFLFAWLLSIVTIPLLRSSARWAFASRPWWGSPVAILGAGKTGKLLVETLRKSPGIGLKPVAILDDNPSQYEDFNDDLIVGPLTKCLELSKKHRISYAIICMPGLSRHELITLMDRYGHCFGHLMVIPDLFGMASLGLSVREIGGIIGLEVTQQLLRPSAQFAKRTLDLFLTLAVLPFALPLIALAAILIKLESPGPVFFASERIGYRGRTFRAWKLRSMMINGDEILKHHLATHPEELVQWNSTQKLVRDPRVTRIGRIIRKTSIDELPQLWNVLIAEMSIVGPRPMFAHQVEMYGSAYTLYKRVRPGITGLWQISGRNQLTFKERAKLDAYVVQNWSIWLDIYIVIRTIQVVISADGAY